MEYILYFFIHKWACFLGSVLFPIFFPFSFLLFVFFFFFKSLKMTFDASPQSARVKGMMRNRAQLGPLGSQSGWGSQVVFCSPVSCFQRT